MIPTQKSSSEKQLFDIDQYSEEMQIVLTAQPIWPIRWGMLAMFFFLMVVFLVSYIIKYPDILNTNFVLSSTNPAVKIISKTSGRIKLLVTDKQKVNKGEIVGYIENTADFESIKSYLQVRELLRNHITAGNLDSIIINEGLNLGELQNDYANLKGLIEEYKIHSMRHELRNGLIFIDRQMSVLKTLNSSIRAEYKLNDSLKSLSSKKLQRDSQLFAQKVISRQEFENSQSGDIPRKITIQTVTQNIRQAESRILDLQNRRNEMNNLEIKYLTDTRIRISAVFSALERDLLSWKEKYLFEAPIKGVINLFEIREDNQIVTIDKEIFTISSTEKTKLIGYANLPVDNSGKVKAGQKVIINLSNFPAQQYGNVIGYIKTITDLPKDGNYYLTIELPNGLVTDIGRPIPFKEQITGTSGIVTEDLRLIERFFFNFKKILKRV